jgi:RHS repeat-associated protein
MLEVKGKRYYYIQDGMGNVVGLTDKDGNLIEEYFYTPYGKLLSKPSEINSYYFSGRRYDPELGLYYLRYRYYSPDLGRFVSREPMLGGDLLVSLLNQTNMARNNYMSMGWLKEVTEANLAELLRVVNLYQYVGNNPISGQDPLGLHYNPPGPWPCMGVGTACIVSGVYLIILDFIVGRLAGPFAPFVSGTWTSIGLIFIGIGIQAISSC